MKISGVVIKGKGKGRKLGFPTVNVLLKKKMSSGVYTGKVYVNEKKYRAGIFVGKDGKILEAYLLDFSGNLYGKRIEIEIGSKIRDVKKFKNNAEFKKQIKKDVKIIRSCIGISIRAEE